MKNCANCGLTIKNGESFVTSVISGSPMHTDCANKCITCGAYLTDEESLKNKFRCNKCSSANDLHLESVRRCHIETYKQCPYEFYLEIIKGVEKDNNAYALHGIMLHEIMEKYSLDPSLNKQNMYEEFKQRYLKEMPKDNLSFKEKPELYEELLRKGATVIDNYIDYEKSALPPWKTEENIVFPICDDNSLPKVSITMDRIEKTSTGLRFVDYKCGKVFAGQKLARDLQVPLYCLACKYKYGELPKQFEFLFLSEAKTRLYTLENDNTYVCYVGKRKYVINITEAIREVKEIFSKMKKRQFSPKNSTSEWYCNNMCYYGKQGICGGKMKELWQKGN